MKDEEMIAVGMPVDMLARPSVPSVRRRCWRCGVRTWVSARLAREATSIECVPCARRAGHIVGANIAGVTRDELHKLGYTDDQIEAARSNMLRALRIPEGKA